MIVDFIPLSEAKNDHKPQHEAKWHRFGHQSAWAAWLCLLGPLCLSGPCAL